MQALSLKLHELQGKLKAEHWENTLTIPICLCIFQMDRSRKSLLY